MINISKMVKLFRKCWESVNNALGFTRQEQLIVVFLLCGLLLGSVVSITKKHSVKKSSFDYDEIKKKFAERVRIRSEEAQAVVGNDGAAKIQEKARISININTASQKELEKLPQIGPVLAKKIIEYRRRQGGFKSAEELRKVSGIGEKVFARIKPYVRIR